MKPLPKDMYLAAYVSHEKPLNYLLYLKGRIYMKKRPDGRYKVSLTIDGKRHYFYGEPIN